jgi:LuxR family maltose regulon positive regulatory protein
MLQYNEKNTFKDIPKATELIKTTIYDKFDEETKEILLKLAILENFTLEQAYYITEDRKCNVIINNLVLNNCFIKYDRKSKLYTLHSIFINALKEEIEGSNINLYKLNNSAGDWYSQNHNYIKAIEYYYRAKNFDTILDLLESTYLIELRNLSPKIINSIFEELPLEKKLSRPVIYLNYIFFCILQGKAMFGAKLLYEAKSIYEAYENIENKNNILGEISVVESFLMFNDVRKMNQYHKKAYELFNGGSSKIANPKMPFTFGSPHILYLYHIKKGELKEMVKNFETDIGYFVYISKGGGSGAEYLMKGEYFFETGDMDKGELFAYKALYKANLKRQTSIIICSLFLLMRIFISKNNKVEVRNNLNSLIKEYENFNIPNFLNVAEIARGYINGITGNLEEIPRWLQNIELSKQSIALSDKSMGYIVSGLAMILKEDFVQLEVYSEIMLESYLKNNNIFGVLYGYIFQSISNYKIYGIEKAKHPILKAINLAQGDNIIMCFVELAPHILPVLRELKEENRYVELLLPKCERFNEIYEESYSNKEKIQLTTRELEVIRLLALGYKQCEISEKLNIALVTVKKHISSVYFKTNAKNKTVALKKLKDIHLI